MTASSSFPDLHQELGQLLIHISDTAIAIRMNTAYGHPRDPERAAVDAMWLADSLHNLHMLGDAIQCRDAGKVIWACDMLLSRYNEYATAEQAGYQGVKAREAFARHPQVSLEGAIGLFQTLRDKAAGGAAS